MRGPGRASALICELAGTSEKPANGTWLSSAYLAQKNGSNRCKLLGLPSPIIAGQLAFCLFLLCTSQFIKKPKPLSFAHPLWCEP